MPSFIGDLDTATFLLSLFVIVFSFVLGGIVNLLIKRYSQDKLSPRVYKPLSKIAMYAIYFGGILLAFRIIEFNIPASLAALGILGIAMLLPTVPYLQGVVSGLVISIERPFKEEDVIEFNNELCVVKDFGLRKTKLRSMSGKIILVPNIIFITSTPVVNYTAGEFIRINVNFDVDPSSSIDAVKQSVVNVCTTSATILPNIPEKKMTKLTKILNKPKSFFAVPKNLNALTPKVYVKGISAQKISFEAWFWIWDVRQKDNTISLFFEKLKKDFDANNIKFGGNG